MADDHYHVLGIERTATPAEIQKAYRDLARKYHPDLNPDDKKAKEKFQKVQSAFEILNDEKKRQMYDQFGPGFENMASGGGGPRGGRASGGPMPEGFEGIDISQLFGGVDPSQFTGGGRSGGGGFADLFEQFRGGGGGSSGGGRRGRGRSTPREGNDLHSEITVPFQTAILGGKTELAIEHDGKRDTISVKIPAGINDGGRIRLRGQGEPGANGGPSGDILLTIHVTPHPHFTRTGDRLDLKLPIKLSEAIHGAKVDVPTPQGTIALRIPPGTNGGTRLRVKGRGVKRKDGGSGDLFAEVQIILPPALDEATKAAIEHQDALSPDPRRDLQW